MARTDANPPLMPYTDEYTLVEVDADYLTKAVKPKQFIHIDQSECIACEGCVDICPWKCIHMVATDAISESVDVEQPGDRLGPFQVAADPEQVVGRPAGQSPGLGRDQLIRLRLQPQADVVFRLCGHHQRIRPWRRHGRGA